MRITLDQLRDCTVTLNIHEAARENLLDEVKLYAEYNLKIRPARPSDIDGRNALHHAVNHKNIEMLKCLLRVAVEPNSSMDAILAQQDDAGDTALTLAIKNDFAAGVFFLIEEGAYVTNMESVLLDNISSNTHFYFTDLFKKYPAILSSIEDSDDNIVNKIVNAYRNSSSTQCTNLTKCMRTVLSAIQSTNTAACLLKSLHLAVRHKSTDSDNDGALVNILMTSIPNDHYHHLIESSDGQSHSLLYWLVACKNWDFLVQVPKNNKRTLPWSIRQFLEGVFSINEWALQPGGGDEIKKVFIHMLASHDMTSEVYRVMNTQESISKIFWYSMTQNQRIAFRKDHPNHTDLVTCNVFHRNQNRKKVKQSKLAEQQNTTSSQLPNTLFQGHASSSLEGDALPEYIEGLEKQCFI